MRKIITTAIAAVMAAGAMALPASAQGFSGVAASVNQANVGGVEQVRHHRGYYRGGRGYYRDRGYYRGRHYHRRGHGDAVAAGVAGLAVGAIVGSALSQPRYYQPAPVYAAPAGGDWHAYCASKYRSYDVRSGTYLAYDGYRRPCR
jgi:hypothetical protein